MMDAIDELKVRAKLVQRRARNGNPAALRRLERLGHSGRRRAMGASAPRLGMCLDLVAIELGFRGWQHAGRVLRGEEEEDQGTLLYESACSAYLNQWFSSYGEAATCRAECGGYLLPYKRQFVVVREPFIEHLGLLPDDGDWQAIGWDWARPKDPDARRRLYAKRMASLAPESPQGARPRAGCS